jgi:hypothetical protein
MDWLFMFGSNLLFYFMGRWDREKEIIDACYKQEVDELRRKVDSQNSQNQAVYEMVKRFNSLN